MTKYLGECNTCGASFTYQPKVSIPVNEILADCVFCGIPARMVIIRVTSIPLLYRGSHNISCELAMSEICSCECKGKLHASAYASAY